MTATSRPRNAVTGAAAAAGAVLALVQGGQAFAHFGRTDHIGLVLVFGALAGLAVAARLWWTGCFESKLFSALLALFALVGQFMHAAIGWPGEPAAGWTAYGILVAVLAPSVLVLLTLAMIRPGRTAAIVD